MSCRTIVCLAVIGLALAGCGKKDSVPTTKEDYARYFGMERLSPKDRTVRIVALPMQPVNRAGGPVDIQVGLSNSYKKARTLPLGLETDEGFVYTFMSALVRSEDGTIERVTFPADKGKLFMLQLKDHETAGHDPLPLGNYYDFEKPGDYEIILFYTVGKGPLPNGTEPEWTGTVWSAPLHIRIQ